MLKRVIFILVLGLIVPCLAIATQCQWGFEESVAGYWSNDNDWYLNAKPVEGEEALIYSGTPAAACVLNEATPAVTNIRMYSGAVLDVQATGTLSQTGIMYIGYEAGTSEVRVSGGSYINSNPATSSPPIRVGCFSGANATLTITGGTVSVTSIKSGYTVGSMGKINLFGGELILTYNSNACIYLNSYGTMELKDTGKLTMTGDRQAILASYRGSGYLYTMQAGKGLMVNYDGTNTTVTVVDASLATPMVQSWGYRESVAGYWSTATDWVSNFVPGLHDSIYVYTGHPAKSCVVDEATATVCDFRIYGGAVLDVQAGGAITSEERYAGAGNGVMIIGYDANALPAEVKISGGSYYSSDTLNTAPRTRLGYVSGSSGILTITEGIYNTNSLKLPYVAGATGRVNLYGGTLILRQFGSSALVFNTLGGGSIDVRAPGKLILSSGGSDLRTWVLQPQIDSGAIFSSDPNTIIVMSFDGNSTILQGVTSLADLNRDNSDDFMDFALFADEWMRVHAIDINDPNPNMVIFAPKTTTTMTIDGSFGASEWSNASDWATFGKWYPDGQGLASTTKVRYTWNDTTDMLYIAIESTEPNQFAEFEVGGLMGDLTTFPTAVPLTGVQATQLHLQSNGSTVVITNSVYDGVTTGVVAAQTWDGTTLRLEIATPIYSLWYDAGTKMELSAGMDIYTYINILTGISGIKKGDGQCTRNGQVNFYGGQAMERGSAVRLLNSLPATCDDIPLGRKVNYANLDGGTDCLVDLADLAVFVEEWLN